MNSAQWLFLHVKKKQKRNANEETRIQGKIRSRRYSITRTCFEIFRICINDLLRYCLNIWFVSSIFLFADARKCKNRKRFGKKLTNCINCIKIKWNAPSPPSLPTRTQTLAVQISPENFANSVFAFACIMVMYLLQERLTFANKWDLPLEFGRGDGGGQVGLHLPLVLFVGCKKYGNHLNHWWRH